MMRLAMKFDGLSEEQARSRMWLFDVNGLLENTRKDLIPEQKAYAQKHTPTHYLVEAVDSIKPSILIGVSIIGKAFIRARSRDHVQGEWATNHTCNFESNRSLTHLSRRGPSVCC
jgi:hypothetical protein